jgi:REP element-mobilizing transposase RayT
MPRQPRLVVPDLPVHIVHRGNNRMACFADRNDYLVYLSLMREAAKRFACVVHAYCLMGNHVHVLLTPAAAHSCALFMHRVAQRYAHYFNRRLNRTGTLWEGRFRSCVVESGSYVIACNRYIHMLNEALGEEMLREIRLATNGGYPLGSHTFKLGLNAPNGRRLIRARPGPAAKGGGDEGRSEPVPDLFSGGGVS